MLRSVLLLLLTWCPVALGGPTIADAVDPTGPCLNYDDSSVTLIGTIFTRIYFGPPNYGEHPDSDGRDTAFLLLLDAPICVSASAHPEQDNNSSESNQILIQLAAVSINVTVLSKAVGKRATVRGSLYHALTGHHRTPVLMDVNDVRIP
jgi:hypothetical protein